MLKREEPAPLALDQVVGEGEGGGFGFVAGADLGVEVAEVMLHGAMAEDELFGKFPVC